MRCFPGGGLYGFSSRAWTEIHLRRLSRLWFEGVHEGGSLVVRREWKGGVERSFARFLAFLYLH